MSWPEGLQINAYTGLSKSAISPLDVKSKPWTGKSIELPPKPLKPDPIVDFSQWQHPEVGWGLVLPDNSDLDPAQRATAIDAPEPLQQLVQARNNAPVLRYSDELPKWAIRRYYPDGGCDPALVGSARGVGRHQIPRYLLIYASPSVIPWEFQYRLNAISFVGRLDLEGEALKNYVDALLSGFSGSQCDIRSTVIWAVDHGGDDITVLMRRALARKINQALVSDPDLKNGATYIDGNTEPATSEKLINALKLQHPALIVTTSHGCTGPLDNLALMKRQMGLPVDANYQALDVDALLGQWQPDGAIWYAHACCSAGSDSHSSYQGLVTEGSYVDTVLNGISNAGALISPLPRRLLGAQKPLRAFIGQVEPTFDWTLKQKETKQLLTSSTVNAMYRHLYQPEPVGMALAECHNHGPALNTIHLQAKAAYNRGEDRLDEALACRLMAVDRESLVVIGDPTAILPPL